MRTIAPAQRLIAALDVSTVEDARTLAASLAGHIGLAKVGLELFVSHGEQAVRAVQDSGLPIFLDLKLHDIPNTVQKSAEAAARLGIRMLTIHASGGAAMVAAARRGLEAGATGERPILLAVTVLTSLSAEDLTAQAIDGTPRDHVVRLARLAIEAGADGLVCSPLEVGAIREALGPEPILVVPGIRPAGGATHDQQRVATPADAVKAGADYLVVGRPLREGGDPPAAARRLADEIASL